MLNICKNHSFIIDMIDLFEPNYITYRHYFQCMILFTFLCTTTSQNNSTKCSNTQLKNIFQHLVSIINNPVRLPIAVINSSITLMISRTRYYFHGILFPGVNIFRQISEQKITSFTREYTTLLLFCIFLFSVLGQIYVSKSR